MTILQSQINNAPKQLCIDLPPEWEHRRLEVTVRAIDETPAPNSQREHPRYRHWKTPARVLVERDALHER